MVHFMIYVNRVGEITHNDIPNLSNLRLRTQNCGTESLFRRQ